MLPEIITKATRVTLQDVEESFKAAQKKNGFNEYGDSTYARLTMWAQTDNFDPDLTKMTFKVQFNCGIRMMGDVTPEDMDKAADEIRLAGKLAKQFTDKLEGVTIYHS